MPKSFRWIGLGLCLLSLNVSALCVACIYERSNRYPMAVERCIPVIELAGIVTIVALAAMFRWRRFALPILGVQVAFYVGTNIYSFTLPTAATPGQIGPAITGMMLLTGVLINPLFGPTGVKFEWFRSRSRANSQ